MFALRYALFAVIASLANLAVQSACLAILPLSLRYGVALVAGTGAGLVVKYLLDRRWIFFDRNRSLRVQGSQFSRYTLTGIATTLIFWVSETTFLLVFDSVHMAQIGAALGLTVGYFIKYRLDRRYVFPLPPASSP
ncbi:GtrA family protein [Pseudooceanicola sp.]|uniref:GtrA family protein n=1 Tax=Pseudooceanicola sp. TaxID=1914328 RepID=UPI00261EE8D7|nr:GtrA family protein [Pseudooceanicola sp.]MDF1855901.1 GtrA family protein [Pseudooceanicola sp.]